MSKKNDNSKAVSILSYLLIGIIWYFADKTVQNDKSVKFHVKQGIVLIIFWIIWSILLSTIFFGTFYFMWGLLNLLSLVPLVFLVIGIINAANNNQKPLPLIGGFAKNFTF